MSYYQNLVKHVLFPMDQYRTGNLKQLRYLREYEKTQFFSKDELYSLQLRRLKKVIDYAYVNCPFYRKQFNRVGVIPSDIQCLDDIHILPFLDKCHIQNNRDEIASKNWPLNDRVSNQTGGSTGTPISFSHNRDRIRSRAAATIRHNRWAGWEVGDKVAYIWGATQDIRENTIKTRLRNILIDRSIYLDTSYITEEIMESYHKQLLRFRPKIIQAYAQSLVLFSRFLQHQGLNPFQPESIVTSAEVLSDSDRVLIEKTFGCQVYDRYGCREFSIIASECDAHSGLHTMDEGLLVEIIKDSHSAGSDESGSIVITDLLNYAMPMIRYRIGDTGMWLEGRCPCGRQLRRLKNVTGRVTDFIVGDDGRLVSGVFLATYIVALRPNLGQIQIRQDNYGEVRYLIKPGVSFDKSSECDFLLRLSKEYLGDSIRVEYEIVDSLEYLPSGKYAFSQSSVLPSYATSDIAQQK